MENENIPTKKKRGRPKGSKTKRILVRDAEAKLMADQRRAKAKSLLTTLDRLDCLAVMESAMERFFIRAVVAPVDEKQSDADLDHAVSIAAMIAPYRHARLAAMKLAGDPNEPLIPDNMTMEQLRQDIVSEVARLGHILDLPVVREPQGIENWLSPGPTNGEGEAE